MLDGRAVLTRHLSLVTCHCFLMAVLKKIRSRLFSTQEGATTGDSNGEGTREGEIRAAPAGAAAGQPVLPLPLEERYDIRPLTVSQLDECWRLDQLCFVDGEAYSRDTFEYLLTSPESVAYRAVTPDGQMIGFIVGLVEPQNTGHITTLGVSPDHRRRQIARNMLIKAEEAFRRRHVRTIRLEVRSVNNGAQTLYRNLGYTITQRLPRYYSNGGDGLLMVKALE
jgi:ribosomal protein S18 acetylase RimI-like enzyme